ncbi:OmpA family protein [Marinomonas sp. 2405UD66-6]|uniref:OmpA family protein n=1 Tax=Marinomonas sp. 2405UD66-6 TaxID=3391834 RepID=UPI0039C98A81
MKVVLLGLALAFGGLQASKLVAEETIDALRYYCHGAGLEFEKSIQVGQGVRIHLNQGAFSQVQSLDKVDPSAEFLKTQMVQTGIRPECAEFLMTKGKQIAPADNVIARVHFSFDSSKLTSESRYILDQLVNRFSLTEAMVVEGNTDSLGSERYNFNLGLKRSQAVASYLEEKGVRPGQMQTVSFGETSPIATNKTADGRYQNRRVDITE